MARSDEARRIGAVQVSNMQATAIFWNGGPRRFRGKLEKAYPDGLKLDGTFIPWRFIVRDLFNPIEWDDKIEADRRGWGYPIDNPGLLAP